MMQHRARLLLIFTCVGCGPETGNPPPEPSEEGLRYASALCGAIEGCGCAHWFPSHGACESRYSTYFDEALHSGLTLIPGCLDEFEEIMAACPSTFDDLIELTSPMCVVGLRGGKAEGEPCTRRLHQVPLLQAEECEEGLMCKQYTRTCREIGDWGFPPNNPPERTAGDTCDPSDPWMCHNRDVHLYCAMDGRCREVTPLGDPCELDRQCQAPYRGMGEPYNYCKGARSGNPTVCTERAEPGEPCDPQEWDSCAWGHWCSISEERCVSESQPPICLDVGLSLGNWPDAPR
jgi:hypothetical protein